MAVSPNAGAGFRCVVPTTPDLIMVDSSVCPPNLQDLQELDNKHDHERPRCRIYGVPAL